MADQPMQTEIVFRSLDGLHLAGTLVRPEEPAGAVVMVHGGGVTREEGGFFTRLAAGLGEAGVASLRYDLRAHGESDGRQEADNVLIEHLNDIRVALADLRERTGAAQISLLGASFGGGLVTYYAAKGPDELARLVLLNPQLNYKDRYIDQKPWWSDDFLDDEAARHLQTEGYLSHSATVKHSRAMLNE